MDEVKKRKLLEHFEVLKKFTAEGYAGCLSNGTIVDRREHPEAIPVQKNSLLNVPEPKDLNRQNKEKEKDSATTRMSKGFYRHLLAQCLRVFSE